MMMLGMTVESAPVIFAVVAMLLVAGAGVFALADPAELGGFRRRLRRKGVLSAAVLPAGFMRPSTADAH